ncbi:MAG: hypothetical protein OHK0019_36270 [Saprospiraceae bacterium]
MKKSLQLVASLLTLLAPFYLSAQTFTIGTNDGTNTSSLYPTPYGDFRESMRAQYLYKSSELAAAGVTEGNITKIGFFVEDVDGVGEHENYTIKLLLTSSEELTNNTWQPGAITVYGPVNYTPTVGLNEHILNAPFFWNGASNANLVVEICHSPPGSGSFATNNAAVQWSTNLSFHASETRAKNDDTSICNTSEAGTQGARKNRPVLSLTLCYPPTALTTNGVTSISADVSWTPPAGNTPAGYDYTYGLADYQPGVVGTELGSGSTTLPAATITGLNGLETYALWVRSDCGDGYSRWTGPLNFTTDPSCNDLFLEAAFWLMGKMKIPRRFFVPMLTIMR